MHKGTWEKVYLRYLDLKQTCPTCTPIQQIWNTISHYGPDLQKVIAALRRGDQQLLRDLVDWPQEAHIFRDTLQHSTAFYAYVRKTDAFLRKKEGQTVMDEVLKGYYTLEKQQKCNIHGEQVFSCSVVLDTEGEMALASYFLQHFARGIEIEELSPMSREEDHSGGINMFEGSVLRLLEREDDRVARQGIYTLLNGSLCAIVEQGIALHDHAHQSIPTFDDLLGDDISG